MLESITLFLDNCLVLYPAELKINDEYWLQILHNYTLTIQLNHSKRAATEIESWSINIAFWQVSTPNCYYPLCTAITCNYYYIIALFTVNFSHLHYNVFERECEAISGRNCKIARNCLSSTFKYIVMQMSKGNCEKGYC